MAWQYVGGTSGVGTSTGYTVSLNGTLTGGIASSPAAGDLIVVISGFANTASSAPAVSGNSSGAYTAVGTAIHANDTWDTEVRPFYKVMGATPDTTLTVTRVTNTAYGGATVVQVWRGVDTSNPYIGTAQTSGTNGCVINCPAYNPAVTDSLIFAAGAGTMAATSVNYTGITGMSNFLTRKGDGSTSDCAVAMATYNYAGASYDPAAISGGTTSTSSSWGGYTFAFRMYVPPAQSLTPSLFDDSTDTFYAPSVTPGAVSLTASLFDDSTDTFYSPTVLASGPTQDITASLFDDSTDTFYGPTAVARKDLLVQIFNDSVDTFHNPTVTAIKVLSATLFDDSADTFYAHVITSANALTATLLDDSSNTFYTPGVSTTNALTVTLFDDSTDTFYNPAVGQSGGPQTIAPTLLDDSVDTFHTPEVTATNGLAASLFDDSVDTFYSASVAHSGTSLVADLFDDSVDTFYAPAVSTGVVDLQPSVFENANGFFSPTVGNSLFENFITPLAWVNEGWVEQGWVAWSAFNNNSFFSATVSSVASTSAELVENVGLFFSPIVMFAGYPFPSDVRAGVVYGPGDIYTGSMSGGGGYVRRM